MAKSSGGAGRYRGTHMTGGLKISLRPNRDDLRRETREWEGAYKSNDYDNDRASLMSAAAHSNYKKISVRDAQGVLMGVAAYEMWGETLHLAWLGSRGGGAGTAIFNKLFQLAADEGKGISLVALENARPFYRKMGMLTDNGGRSFYLGAEAVLKRAEALDNG